MTLRWTVWRDAITLALVSRLGAFLAGVAGIWLLGFPHDRAIPASAREHVIVNLAARWDTTWYIGLASGGYRWDGAAGRFENIAFFPAYPAVVGTIARGLGLTTAEAWNWLGAVVSTVLFAWALAALRHLARRHLDAGRARFAATFCACAPFGVFFGVAYTESLFLLAAVHALWKFEEGKFTSAAIWGLVLGLCRPTAPAVTVALAAGACAEMLRRRPSSAALPRSGPERLSMALAIAAPVLGVLIYSAYVFGLTGDALMWAKVQAGWGRPTQNPVVAVVTPLLGLASDPAGALIDAPYAVLNASAAVFALAAAWPIARRLGAAHATFVVVGTLAPLTAGGVASLGRYTAVLFPLYVWLAAVLPARSLPLASAALASCAAVVAALFFSWRPMY